MKRFLLWLISVALGVVVLLAAVMGVSYAFTTEGGCPDDAAQFGGQALEANGSCWQVPLLGGKLDKVISEVINVFLMIPSFFLVLIIVAMFGSSMVNVMFVIGLTSWPSNARMMRVQAMSIKERTFVKSAVAMGESKRQILFKYIIPNGLFPVIANTTMGVAKAILTEASLSFLGLGDPNVVSWGQMIFDGKQYLTSGWWMSTFAGLCIMLIVMIFYLIGDGLNYALNPKMKKI